MERMLTGLRHRLERALHRVEEQHRLLREIADALDGAVASGSPSEIERWLGRFLDALRSHFDLEESIVFPALHGMMKGARTELVQLENEHGVFLERLRDLAEPGDAEATLVDVLGGVRQKLRDHERAEEGLIERALALRGSVGSDEPQD